MGAYAGWCRRNRLLRPGQLGPELRCDLDEGLERVATENEVSS